MNEKDQRRREAIQRKEWDTNGAGGSRTMVKGMRRTSQI